MIITYPLNGISYTAEDAESYLCTRTSGVFSSENHFMITITGDRQVTISPGLAWIRNSDFAGKSVLNTADVALNVPVADGALDRIDRVVLRFDKAMNSTSLKLLIGMPASAPVAPGISRTELVYDLALYDIRVPAASIRISSANITSNLLDESLCGIMRDGVTQIPTAQLQEQAGKLLDQIGEELAGVQEGALWLRKSGGVMTGAIAFENSAAAAQTRENMGLSQVAASGSFNDLADVPEDFGAEVDDTVTASGTNPVSGAAVAAYAQPVLVKKAVGDGAIAVEGAAEHSFVGLRIYGKTTQNGTPSPDAPVELVNVGEDGNIGVTVCGRNLQPYPYAENTKTQNGIAFTVMDDGTVVVNGTATAGTFFRFNTADAPIPGLEVGRSYIFSACPKGGAYNTYYARMLIDGQTTPETGSGIEFIAGSINYAYIYIAANTTVNNVVFKPMIRLATDTDETYESFKSPGNLTLSTPNGLPGIPIASGGNYTDENGQQWLCDEIDLDRGVYVRRITKRQLTSSSHNWIASTAIAGRYFFDYSHLTGVTPMCSHFVGVNTATRNVNEVGSNGGIQIVFNTNFATVEEWKTWLDANEVWLMYPIASITETALSDTELNTYETLRAFKPNTTVLNDSGAGMEVKCMSVDAEDFYNAITDYEGVAF